jgi:hypothetical protein
MQKLKSSSTAFEIWYEELLYKIVKHIQAGLRYVLPIQQAKSKYGSLFNPNIFEADIESICAHNNLRIYCLCKNRNIYVGPL